MRLTRCGVEVVRAQVVVERPAIPTLSKRGGGLGWKVSQAHYDHSQREPPHTISVKAPTVAVVDVVVARKVRLHRVRVLPKQAEEPSYSPGFSNPNAAMMTSESEFRSRTVGLCFALNAAY